MILVTIIIFVLMLALLIFVHEGGHFVAARLTGVKVEEFGMGFPPRIFAVKRGETEYSLNWIPLGGFCKMLGEEDPDEPRSLASKKPLSRLFVLSAGSLVMFVLPFVLFPIANMIPHSVIVDGEGVQITRVEADSPALKAGIEVDDVILSVDGKAVETIDELVEVIDSKIGVEVTMVLEGISTTKEITIVPRSEPPLGQGPLGIGLGWETMVTESRAYPPWEAIPLGVEDGWRLYVIIKDVIQSLIQGSEPFVLTGIVGIAHATGDVVDAGFMALVTWTCLVSINLAIVNLLPIPALDGGRIVFVFLEVVRRGKRVSPRTEGLVHFVGFMMLIILILVISYYDIVRVIEGEHLIQ